MLVRSWLVASACALLVVQSAPAQRGTAPVSVRGVAFDGLHGAPLRNAFVAIIGTSLTGHTDTSGRFRIDSVPPGTYVFALHHGLLDSLGLTDVSTRASVTDGREEVTIAVPTFATLWRITCGPGRPPHDSGFVYGAVLDASSRAPVANAFVDMTWIEIQIARSRGVTQKHRRIETRTDANGAFRVCGVPAAHWLRIGAGVASGASGTIDLPPSDLRVQRRDLLIGLANRAQINRGTVMGVLADPSGGPVAEARVILDDTAEVRSREDGTFLITNVAAGTRQLEILSLGMRPVVTAIDVIPNDTATFAVQLRKVTTLDIVRVTASRRGRLLAEELAERRKTGQGYMMDGVELARHATLSSVFNEFPSSHVEYRHGNVRITLPDGRGGLCEADVWIDGARSAQAALNMMQPKDVAAIELFPRASTIPTRYRRDVMRRSCGAILVWTNWALGRG
jgi:hypothetical protein